MKFAKLGFSLQSVRRLDAVILAYTVLVVIEFDLRVVFITLVCQSLIDSIVAQI